MSGAKKQRHTKEILCVSLLRVEIKLIKNLFPFYSGYYGTEPLLLSVKPSVHGAFCFILNVRCVTLNTLRKTLHQTSVFNSANLKTWRHCGQFFVTTLTRMEVKVVELETVTVTWEIC